MITYNFQAKFEQGSLDETLVRFLKKKDGITTEKNLIWMAAKAYWLPLAMASKNTKSYSQQEIIGCAGVSLSLMDSQKAVICTTFGLNYPNSQFTVQGDSTIAIPSQNGSHSDQMTDSQIDEANQVFPN